jgi:hypothetical protein
VFDAVAAPPELAVPESLALLALRPPVPSGVVLVPPRSLESL